MDGGARQEAVDTFNGMSGEQQKFLQTEATRIVTLHEDGKELLPYVHSLRLDPEEKLAIWSLLPSPVRTAFKKEEEQHRREMALPKKVNGPTPGQLGSQGD